MDPESAVGVKRKFWSGMEFAGRGRRDSKPEPEGSVGISDGSTLMANPGASML